MKEKDGRPFAQRHPRWNFIIGLLTLIILIAIGALMLFFIVKYIGVGIAKFVDWLNEISSKLDAVVIVALITGAVSIIGVVISSVIAKRIEYKKQRQSYLAQKREKSYGEFVEMVYKIQVNSKNPGTYTEKDMINDILSFSQELTLWGSKNVAEKWVKFRHNGANPESAQSNLFLLEEIMNDMRHDLGVKRVTKGKLLSFFVNDIDTVLRKKK